MAKDLSPSRSELILHPVRLRLIQALLGERHCTVQQLSDALPDVARTTLYRQINILVRAGILRTVQERPIRGAVEKVYALNSGVTHLGPHDIANATREDHLHYFTTFILSLLDDFRRYLQRPTVDLLADGVGYQQVPLYLSDAEFVEAMAALSRALLPYMAYPRAGGRRRRILTTVVLPADEPESSAADET